MVTVPKVHNSKETWKSLVQLLKVPGPWLCHKYALGLAQSEERPPDTRWGWKDRSRRLGRLYRRVGSHRKLDFCERILKIQMWPRKSQEKRWSSEEKFKTQGAANSCPNRGSFTWTMCWQTGRPLVCWPYKQAAKEESCSQGARACWREKRQRSGRGVNSAKGKSQKSEDRGKDVSKDKRS